MRPVPAEATMSAPDSKRNPSSARVLRPSPPQTETISFPWLPNAIPAVRESCDPHLRGINGIRTIDDVPPPSKPLFTTRISVRGQELCRSVLPVRPIYPTVNQCSVKRKTLSSLFANSSLHRQSVLSQTICSPPTDVRNLSMSLLNKSSENNKWNREINKLPSTMFLFLPTVQL